MNILFYIGVYPGVGGTEKTTTLMANDFAEKGHKVSIVSFFQKKKELANLLNTNIKLYYLDSPVFSVKNFIKLRSIFKKERPIFVYNQWSLPFYTNMMINFARRGQKCYLFSLLHGVPDRSLIVIKAEDQIKQTHNALTKSLAKLRYYAITKLTKFSLRYVYKYSDRYIVLSNGFVKSFQKYSGLKYTPRLISQFSSNDIVTDYENDYIPTKRKQILYVGRLDNKNKCVYRVIETWKLLESDFPEWKVIIVGDGPDKESLETLTAKYHLSRVSFTGYIKEDPITLYKESSILLLTSDLEGLGLVVIEGMSYGVVPIVYGSYETIYEMIENEKEGYIIPKPFSTETMAEKIRTLITNDTKRKKMAYASVERSKYFSVESVQNRWYQLMDEFIKTK